MDNKEHEKLKLKVFTAFSGYDSQCMALERLKENYPWFDYELVGWSEIDEPAIASHNAVFPEAADKNLGDISKVNWKEVEDFDLFTYSSPCLTEDQLILTRSGYKEIKDIKVGEEVLTKSNTWHPVVKKFDNGLHRTCYVEAMGFDRIHCTYNHKFWVREMKRVYVKNEEKNRRDRKRVLGDWIKVEAKDLTKNHYFGVPVIKDEIPYYTDEEWFWYLCGMYVGDGWVAGELPGNAVKIAGNVEKIDKMKSTLDSNRIKYRIEETDGGSCYNLTICDKDLHDFLYETFGKYSDKKRIPGSVIMLPKKELTAFYNGYRDSDGCTLKKNNNIVQFSSVNRQLIHSISLIINKLFHRPTCIYYIKTPDTHVIEGRTVNQKDWYQLRYRKEHTLQEHAFIEDDYIWYPFKKIVEAEIENVYNIEVEEDHSYVLSGAISLNCQDFSCSGKQMGGEPGSGTRSSLLWECQRTIEEKRPKYCLLENVKALYSDKKFYPLLMKWKRTVDSYGYNSFIKVLNAADYDIPQGRERVFMVSIRKDNPDDNTEYYFPAPMKRTREIEDFLCDDVPEEYYLSDKKVPKFLDLLYNTGDDFDEKSEEHTDMIERDKEMKAAKRAEEEKKKEAAKIPDNMEQLF